MIQLRLKKFAFILFLFQSSFSIAQNISGVINIYTVVDSILRCPDAVRVSSAAGFTNGDRVLIIQMKGAAIDTSNTSSFGSINSYSDAGNYEFADIASIAGTTIFFRTVSHVLIRLLISFNL